MRDEDTIFCDGCGVEINWAPVRANHEDYCCEDCKAGLECSCGARLDEDDYPRGGGANPYEEVSV